MDYLKECDYIWNNLVPDEGKADSLQGELLRLIEKIAYEVQFRGSINWGVLYEDYCDFIKTNLINSKYLNDHDKENLANAIGEIRIIAREQYNINKNNQIKSYNEEYNELFDIIRNIIGKVHKKANKLINYEK